MYRRSTRYILKRIIAAVLLLCALMALAGCSSGNSTKECVHCNGTGILSAGGRKFVCPICDGKGYTDKLP